MLIDSHPCVHDSVRLLRSFPEQNASDTPRTARPIYTHIYSRYWCIATSGLKGRVNCDLQAVIRPIIWHVRHYKQKLCWISSEGLIAPFHARIELFHKLKQSLVWPACLPARYGYRLHTYVACYPKSRCSHWGKLLVQLSLQKKDGTGVIHLVCPCSCECKAAQSQMRTNWSEKRCVCVCVDA